jgi:hypothetical protein
MSTTMLTPRDRCLVSLSASVASGCVPCTNYYLAKAQGVGLVDEDAHEALARGIAIRRLATEALARTLGCDSGDAESADPPGAPHGPLVILQSLGAAYAVNCDVLVARFLNASTQDGIAVDLVHAAIQIARGVRGMAGRVVDARLERHGIPPESDPPDACACA